MERSSGCTLTDSSLSTQQRPQRMCIAVHSPAQLNLFVECGELEWTKKIYRLMSKC
jgi:hypothetical protein